MSFEITKELLETVTSYIEASNDAEKIDLTAVAEIADFTDLTANHMVQDTLIVTDVLITAGADTIRLENVQLSDLHETDFIFV